MGRKPYHLYKFIRSGNQYTHVIAIRKDDKLRIGIFEPKNHPKSKDCVSESLGGSDPTPCLVIGKGIPDRILERRNLDPQNPLPLLRLEQYEAIRLGAVVVWDTRPNTLYSERNGGLLGDLDVLLVRDGLAGDDDSFVSRGFLLERHRVGYGNISDINPAGSMVETLAGWVRPEQ